MSTHFQTQKSRVLRKADPAKAEAENETLEIKEPNHVWQSLALAPAAFQPKLAVSRPDDPYEQEADRVADRVMRMTSQPASAAQVVSSELSHFSVSSLKAQRKYSGEEEQEKLERKENAANSDIVGTVPTLVHQTLHSPGQSLDPDTRAFFEPRFGRDFSQVRVHAGAAAAESAKAINARAYTVGQDVVFGEGRYAAETVEGKRLLAHELAHVAQQSSEPVVRRDPAPPPPADAAKIARLRQLLADDEGAAALVLMARLNDTERQQVYASSELKNLATSAFDDIGMARAVGVLGGTLLQKLTWMKAEDSNWRLVKEKIQATSDRNEKEALYLNNEMRDFFVDVCDDRDMAEAVDLLVGTLLQKLTWMKAEDSNWSLVKEKIRATSDPNQKVALYHNNEMRDFFVEICDDVEMAEAVALLGGTLLQKLTWMKAEDSNWSLVKAKIVATVDPNEKVALYRNSEMRDFFVEVCDDQEMAQAVAFLGGTLLQKLTWMKAEDSNWSLVKAKIVATVDPNEKVALYGTMDIVDLFVDVCNDKEMTEAVNLLGGTLVQKLRWMLAEETDAEYMYGVIRVAPATELPAVLADQNLIDGLRRWLSGEEFQRVHEMLSQGLLNWEEQSQDYTEEHYEQESPADPWELKSFGMEANYEIRYTRSELRIIVRIELTGVTAPPALQQTWIAGIQNRWNNHFHIENSRRLAVLVDPIFTSTDAHHTIEVHDVPASGVTREDGGNFFTNTTGDTAAHEFGHLVGLEDEYNLTAADFQRLSGTPAPAGPEPPGGHTIPGLMGTTGNVEGRHLAPFLNWLNSHRLAGERPYRLMPGP